MNNFDMATNYELAMDAFEAEQKKIRDAQKEGVVLLTKDGPIEGWFVGTVEYAVDGYETDWEIEYMLAFRKKNGRIVGADWDGADWSSDDWDVDTCTDQHVARWNLHSIKEVDGVICWDTYPRGLPEEKRSGEFFAPKTVTRPRLSNFIDTPSRTDAGMSLFVVKVWKDRYGTEIYAGHNRKVAAKKMKEMRRLGYRCTTLVFPVHGQNEYNELPF